MSSPTRGESAVEPRAPRARVRAWTWALAASLTSAGLGGAARADQPSLAPEAGLFELGLFGGLWLPPTSHEFYDVDTQVSKPLKSVNPDLGLRLGYYPLSFLGLELEGAFLPTGLRDQDASATVFGVRGQVVGQLPFWRITPFALLGYGNYIISSDPGVLGDDADGEIHYGFGAKFFAHRYFGLRLEARHVFSAAEEVAITDNGDFDSHWEFLGSLFFTFGREDAKPVDDDPDKDGFKGAEDKCPTVPGIDPDGCPAKDTDGDGFTDDVDKCPKKKGKAPDGCPVDTDKDGFLDEDDRCPTEAGVAPDGCPDRDPDKDGILNPTDKCPSEPGIAPHGCPDLDEDGIYDEVDKCPRKPETMNGYQDQDGCPDELPKALKKFTGAIQGITFETGSAKIKPSSFKVLDGAVKVLREFQDVRLEISGHTDDRGSADLNRKLSKARAESVQAYLSSKGIEEGRFTTVGYGPDKPVASNKTKAGMAKNRRIEFRLLNPGSGDVGTD